MKEMIRKRIRGLFAFALSMCMLFGSTMCVEATTYYDNYAPYAYNQLSGVGELYEGDEIGCESGGFRILYDGSFVNGSGSTRHANDDNDYNDEYEILAVPGGTGYWHIDSISETAYYNPSAGSGPCYTIELSSVIEDGGDGGAISGTVEHTSRDARERHKTTDSKKYDYVETENGIAYGGFVDGKWSATTMVPASAYPKFGKFVEKKISQAESGKDVVMNCEPWTSLPKEVLEAFAAKGDISLTLNYTYEGNRYTVKIPAGTDVSTLVDENGYSGLAFLGAKFGAVPYTEPEEI